MEYLNSFDDDLKSIDESNIIYYDLFDFPEFVYGNLNYCSTKTDFCKYPPIIQREMNNFDDLAIREMKSLNSASCGNRLRFHTNSPRVIFKVQLKRRWGYLKMVNWNASGFDVYNVVDGNYIHRTVFAPMEGQNIFSDWIYTPSNGKICIFLPNYNTIEHMYIGIEKDSFIKPFYYDFQNRLPILFYGNSVTQGAAASRSGNSFPNIVSKKLDKDIINLSCSACCKGTDATADLIGKINCDSIVIDYTRNAWNIPIFKESHEKFYKNVRYFHPDKKIILLTSECFNKWIEYDEFDNIVIETYNNAIDRNENTFLINQRELFEEDEYNYVSIDSAHYTDYGMFKIANKICDILKD